MKCYILSRVSSDDQAKGGSQDSQAFNCKEYARKNHHEIVDIIKFEESATYKKKTKAEVNKERAEFKRVIKLMSESKEPMLLIVDIFDRLSRSFRDWNTIEDLITIDGNSIYVNADDKLITPKNFEENEEYIEQRLSDGRKEIRKLKRRVKEANETHRRNGLAFKMPEGYIRKHGEVIYDENKLKMIRLAHELIWEGKSQSEVRDHLNEIGWKSRFGSKMSSQTFYNLIRNPFYMGLAKHADTTYPHKYKTILTPNEFNRTKQILEKRKNLHPKTSSVKQFIFRNILTCRECGKTINPDSKKNGRLVYYRCVNKNCNLYQHNLREEEIVRQVEEIFNSIVYPKELVDQIVEKIKLNNESYTENLNRMLQDAQNAVQEIKNRKDKLLDLHLTGSITSIQFKEKNYQLDNELKEQEFKIAGVKNYNNSHLIEADTVFKLASKLPEIFQRSNIEEKQKILNFIISNAYKEAKSVEFKLKQPFNILLKYNKNQNWFGDRDSNPS